MAASKPIYLSAPGFLSWLDHANVVLKAVSLLASECITVSKHVVPCRRLEAAEGSLTQLSEQMRDHAVSVMSAIQDQNTSDKVAHNVDEQVGSL